jgi:S1-C subfamily serine protease
LNLDDEFESEQLESSGRDDVSDQMSALRHPRRRIAALTAASLILGGLLSMVATNLLANDSPHLNSSAAFEQAVDFTVAVNVSNDDEICWQGSGILVGDGSYVLTNAHVVPGNYQKPPYITSPPPDPTCNYVEIGVVDSLRESEIHWFDATIVEARETLDLSLLKIDDPPEGGLPIAEIEVSDLSLGSPIRVLGYPDFGLDSMVLTNGTVAGFQKRDYGYLFSITAKIGHGNSGGPVLSETGKVVGIMTLGSPQAFDCWKSGDESFECTATRDSLGFAIPIEFAKPLLDLAEQR